MGPEHAGEGNGGAVRHSIGVRSEEQVGLQPHAIHRRGRAQDLLRALQADVEGRSDRPLWRFRRSVGGRRI